MNHPWSRMTHRRSLLNSIVFMPLLLVFEHLFRRQIAYRSIESQFIVETKNADHTSLIHGDCSNNAVPFGSFKICFRSLVVRSIRKDEGGQMTASYSRRIDRREHLLFYHADQEHTWDDRWISTSFHWNEVFPDPIEFLGGLDVDNGWHRLQGFGRCEYDESLVWTSYEMYRWWGFWKIDKDPLCCVWWSGFLLDSTEISNSTNPELFGDRFVTCVTQSFQSRREARRSCQQPMNTFHT